MRMCDSSNVQVKSRLLETSWRNFIGESFEITAKFWFKLPGGFGSQVYTAFILYFTCQDLLVLTCGQTTKTRCNLLLAMLAREYKLKPNKCEKRTYY